MGFDISKLATWTEERAQPILMEAILANQTISLLNPLTGIKGKTKVPIISTDYDILQDDSCSPTAKGDITIDQRQFDPKPLTALLEFCEKDLEPFFTRQWLPPGSDYEGDFTDIEDLLLDTLRRNIEKVMELVVWLGEDGGSNALASLNLVDGFNTVITDEIAAATIPASQQITGGLTVSTATTNGMIKVLRDMIDALDADLLGEVLGGMESMAFYMGHDKKRIYERSVNEVYKSNASIVQDDVRKTFFENTNTRIIGVNGLNNTDKIVLAKNNNLWYGTDIDDEWTNFKAFPSENKRKLFLDTQFKWSVQIAHPAELVVANY